jgi:predicted PurR-regulated permease PerM
MIVAIADEEALWERRMLGIDVRTARAVWTAALVVLALYCVYTVRTTLLVVLFGVFFSYLVYPLFSVAQRVTGGHVPRVPLLLAVFAVIIGVLVLLGTLFGSQLAEEAQTLAAQLPKLLEPGEMQKRLPLPSILEPFRARLGGTLQRLLQGGTAQALVAARSIGTGLLHVAGNLIYVVVVPILSFLMVLDAPIIAEQTIALSKKKNAEFWSNVARGLNELLSHYVRALALLSLATVVIYSAVLSLMGVPFALLLALLAALLEIIPVFGPLIAAVSILAVAGMSGYEHMWWLVLFFVAYRIFQDYVLNPYLMSEGVNVPPILVVFGLLAGDELAGVPGIFLSVPVLAAARIVAVQIRIHRQRLLQGKAAS